MKSVRLIPHVRVEVTKMSNVFKGMEMEIIYHAAMFGFNEHFNEIARYFDIDDDELEIMKAKLLEYLTG